jgi:hypothetical protein
MRERQHTRLSVPDFSEEDLFTQPWDFKNNEGIEPLFALLEATGTFRPGSLESQYAGVFFDALAEGSISDEDRERLNLAAAALGLTDERRSALEDGWRRAYQGGAALGRAEDVIVDDDPDVETSSLPLAIIRGRAATPAIHFNPSTKADPDVPDLTRLLEQATQRGDHDARMRIASILVRRHGAPPEAQETVDELMTAQVSQPLHSLGEDAWTALVDPSEQFLLASSIFREVAAPALLARASAFRLDGRKVPGAPENLATTKVSAVRAFAWCAAHLGIPCPSIHVIPDLPKAIEFVPTLPATVLLGKPLLDAEPFEVAFECARHLSLHRPEHYITLLVPDVISLEDVFHAALLLIVSDLPIEASAFARACLNRDALKPALDVEAIERLRHLVRTQVLIGLPDLDEWVDTVERTTDRVGLLLAGDFGAAARILQREPGGPQRLANLETFWMSRGAGALRHELGVSLSFIK